MTAAATPGSINAFKLALAAWPRSASDSRPGLRRTVDSLSRAMAGPFLLLPYMNHDGPVVGAVFDKAEGRILSWSSDGTARLWDTATGAPHGAVMKHDGPVVGADFDKTETRVLSWSEDGTVRLWDARTGEPRGTSMKHEGPVLGAVFDKAEERILSWSNDRTVRLWDAATGQPRGAPMKLDRPVVGAVFDKSETRILTWSSDGTVRLWDVARLGPGNLVEAACGLVPDKDVSTLRRDVGIEVTDPICSRDGRDAPAPDFRELVD